MNDNIHKYIPAGRIKTLDILRGLAIILMTLYHQLLPFELAFTAFGRDLAIVSVFYTRAIFIAVSGIAIVLYEQKYRHPFKMIIHGVVLFTMAWCADIVTHQSFAIDWDIFQLIGGCYAIAGLFNYIGKVGMRFGAILFLLILMYFIPVIRPDRGIFPIWPNGVYFMIGYIICHWSISQYGRLRVAFLFFIASAVYLPLFHFYGDLSLKLAFSAFGLAASTAAIFLLLFSILLLENRDRTGKFPFPILLRFGQYPVSLYFFQQFFTVFGIKFGLKLTLTAVPSINCTLQASSLLFGMYLLTFIFDRFKFLCVEFWLGKAESFIMNRIPPIGIFGPMLVKLVF